MLLNVHSNKPHDQNVHVLQVMFWIEGKGNWRENSKDLNFKFTKAKKNKKNKKGKDSFYLRWPQNVVYIFFNW